MTSTWEICWLSHTPSTIFLRSTSFRDNLISCRTAVPGRTVIDLNEWVGGLYGLPSKVPFLIKGRPIESKIWHSFLASCVDGNQSWSVDPTHAVNFFLPFRRLPLLQNFAVLQHKHSNNNNNKTDYKSSITSARDWEHNLTRQLFMFQISLYIFCWPASHHISPGTGNKYWTAVGATAAHPVSLSHSSFNHLVSSLIARVWREGIKAVSMNNEEKERFTQEKNEPVSNIIYTNHLSIVPINF